jgi:hypothetical protein
VIDQPRVAHNVDPAHGSDDETDPEGQHDQKKKNLLVTALAAVKEIGGHIAHDDTDDNRFKGNPNRPDENFRIEKVFEKLGVVPQLKGRYIGPAGGAQPEAVNDNETDRYNQE